MFPNDRPPQTQRRPSLCGIGAGVNLGPKAELVIETAGRPTDQWLTGSVEWLTA